MPSHCSWLPCQSSCCAPMQLAIQVHMQLCCQFFRAHPACGSSMMTPFIMEDPGTLLLNRRAEVSRSQYCPSLRWALHHRPCDPATTVKTRALQHRAVSRSSNSQAAFCMPLGCRLPASCSNLELCLSRCMLTQLMEDELPGNFAGVGSRIVTLDEAGVTSLGCSSSLQTSRQVCV